MTDDEQLLRQYRRERSESAFTELVTRYIDLVYSSALRVVNGDAHLAQDVTQTVFIHLARKARSLPCGVVLAGWLHRHTCFAAATAVRTERRRKAREQTALEMKALDDNTQPPWEMIAPYLDESLDQLNSTDRDALVLRFLKRQDFRAVGQALGISEDAAQKRVSRALEKLRETLRRRGVALTVAALTSVLATNTLTAAPAGLAVVVTAASLAAAAKTGTGLTFLKLMAATKLKSGIIGAIVIASIATPLLIQHQAKAKLREQDEALRQKMKELAKVQQQNADLSIELSRSKGSSALSGDQWRELMKRRGQVGRLRRDLDELAKSKPASAMSRTDKLASMAQRYSQRIDHLKHLLDEHPSERIPELQFLTNEDWRFLAGEGTPETEEGHQRAMSLARQIAESYLARDVLRPALQRYAQENGGKFPADLSQLKPYLESPIDDPILQRWQIVAASRLVNLGEDLRGEDWVITQKAPVNRALDQRAVLSLKAFHLFADAPPAHWDVIP